MNVDLRPGAVHSNPYASGLGGGLHGNQYASGVGGGVVHNNHYASVVGGHSDHYAGIVSHTDHAVTECHGETDLHSPGTASGAAYLPPHQSYQGCFGLPYQDHNYGAPPPPSPPPLASPQKTQIPLVVPQEPQTPERNGGHIEVDDVGTAIGPSPVEQEVTTESVASAIDDSITRCICDFIHDDGYMICCDKCSVWQHIDCMDIDRNNIPDSYFCEICDPRPLDKERARLIQLKKKEFLDTLTADSSATDTDPEMETNGQMSQYGLNGQLDGQGVKKVKNKRRTKSGSLMPKGEGKQRRVRKDKKEIKKEKENKDLFKKQKMITKETVSGMKTVCRKSKLMVNKKPGLSLLIHDNTQDPWDSSYSPWVDKYEEAYENQYSPELKALISTTRINGVHADRRPVNGQLPVQLCHVTEVNKNRKGLEASQTIGEGEAVIEYTGKVMFKHQLDRDNFYNQLNPFVLFYNKINNFEVCIDATSYGNIARFIRRSCKANAEICHEVHDGNVKFYVYSTKVIPRGSEITIPYDYSYKDCTYCVECACLRNNCPVAKFFKKKFNTPNKKDKTPTKNHKSPLKSPIKLTIKSPIKKLTEEEVGVKQEDQKVEVESVTPPVEERPAPRAARRESLRSAPTEQISESSMSGQQPASADVQDDPETAASSTAAAQAEKHKMTREEKKLEAIMKAFEKMEKREERRKEALHRIDQRKSQDGKPEEKEKPEKIKKEEKKEKPKEKEKHTRERSQRASKEASEPVKESFPEVVEVNEVKVEEEVKEEVKVKEEAVVDPPQEPTVVPVVKEKPKPKTKKARKVAARRRTRASTISSTIPMSEPALSIDDSSNPTPAPPPASCPATPAQPDTPNTPPSFKFLKTKKHLMNEWLNEKNQESIVTSTPSSTPRADPLHVDVEETMFVTCLPSPRNAMEHLRRNSQSSGSSSHRGNPAPENSIGSAKKRWLRQAMWEKPKIDTSVTISNTPSTSTTPGSASPNPNLLSPGASPPGDFVTPLKKRRLARESCDTQPAPGSTTTSPSVTPIPCTEAPCTDTTLHDDSDTSGVESMSTSVEEKITSPGHIDSRADTSRKGSFVSPRDCNLSSTRDSMDSEVSESYPSTRSSVDLSSDSEQERTCQTTVSHTGNSNSVYREERTSVVSTCSNSLQNEEFCEVSNSVDNRRADQNSQVLGSGRDSVLGNGECDSRAAESGVTMEITETEQATERDVAETMEVDSTEDVSSRRRWTIPVVDSNTGGVVGKRPSVCDSTSVNDESCHVSSVEQREEQPGCSTDVKRSLNSQSVRVDSSTDTPLTGDRNLFDLGHQLMEGTLDSSQDSKVTEQSEQEVISASDQQSAGEVRETGESVGSSSDGRQSARVFNSVSSSSEYKLRNQVESSQVQDVGGSVTSSGNFSISENSNSVSGSEVADSSMCETSGTREEGEEEFTVEAEVVNISDSVYGSIDHDITSLVTPTVGGEFPSHGEDRPDDALCSSSSVSEETRSIEHFTTQGAEAESLVQEGRPEMLDLHTMEGSEADSMVQGARPSMLQDGNEVQRLDDTSNMDDEVPYSHGEVEGVHTSYSHGEVEGVYTSALSEPEPTPPPTKKKVSLLEYRKRLKEKGSTSNTSSSSSSSTPASSSSSSSSSSSYSLSSSSSSCTARASSTSTIGSTHRLSLPSLPLFDASSPTKESSHSRHQFKSSSDLIKRKAVERKREKPLSLTERLKKEFGFEDCEEEAKAEALQASSSHHAPPPPPPPPTSSTVGTPRKNKPYEPAEDPPPPPQSTTQQGQGSGGHTTSLPGQVTQGQVGQQIPSLVGVTGEVNRGVAPSPLLRHAPPTMVPPPAGLLPLPSSTTPAPATLPAPGGLGQPVSSPGLLANGLASHTNGPVRAAVGSNGTALPQPGYGQPAIQPTKSPVTGSKIPSLLSLKTYPAPGPRPGNQQSPGSSTGVPPVNGPSTPLADQSHQNFIGISPQNQPGIQPSSMYQPQHLTTHNTNDQQQAYPPPPHPSSVNGGQRYHTHQSPQVPYGQTVGGASQVTYGQTVGGSSQIPYGQTVPGSSQVAYGQAVTGSSQVPYGQGVSGTSQVGYGQSVSGSAYHPQSTVYNQTNGMGVHEYNHGYKDDKHSDYSDAKRSSRYSDDKHHSYSDDKHGYRGSNSEDKHSYRGSDDKHGYRGSEDKHGYSRRGDSPSQSHYSPGYHSQRKKSKKSKYSSGSGHSSHRYSDSRYH